MFYCCIAALLTILFPYITDFWTTRCTRCPAALDALNERAVKVKAATEAAEPMEAANADQVLLGDDDFSMSMDNNTSNNSNPSAFSTKPAVLYHKTRFVSICCGESSDTARSILNSGDADILRWTNIRHYYMDSTNKEIAKSILGFAQVPFYVILSAGGIIVQKGNKSIIWDVLVRRAVPMSVPAAMAADEPRSAEQALDNAKYEAPTSAVDITIVESKSEVNDDATNVVSPTSVQEPVFSLDDMDF
jgi:hypothetical protein